MYDPLSLKELAQRRNDMNKEIMATKGDILDVCEACLRQGIIRYSKKTGKYHCVHCYQVYTLPPIPDYLA